MNARPAGMSDSDDSNEEGLEYVSISNPKLKKKNSFISNSFESSKVESTLPTSQNLDKHQNEESLDLIASENIWQSISAPNRFKTSPKQNKKFPTQDGTSLEEFRMALVQGNLSIIKIALTSGIGVDQVLRSGWTPLMFASSSARSNTVLYLLQQGANVHMHKEMFTPLMAACASSQESEDELLSCINHLLDFGAKAEMSERHRMTPLMFACKEGREKIVKRLLQEKIDIDKQDNKGWTALSWAAARGHGLVIRTLLENGADATRANSHGQTSTDIAMTAGHMEVGEMLDRASNHTLVSNEDGSLPLKKSGPMLCFSSSPYLSKTHCGEMEMVLAGLELSHLKETFQKNKITLELFLRLNEDDLVRLGVDELGSRKKLLHAICNIHKQEWKTGSIPNLMSLDHISMPDAVAMVRNINKHLRYVHASIGHLRDEIQNTPRILEIGQEKHNVATLSECFSESLKNLSYLGHEVTFFKAHLDKVRNNVEFSAADTITACNDDGRQWQRRLVASVGATAIAVSMLYLLKPKAFASIFSLSYYPQPRVFLDVMR